MIAWEHDQFEGSGCYFAPRRQLVNVRFRIVDAAESGDRNGQRLRCERVGIVELEVGSEERQYKIHQILVAKDLRRRAIHQSQTAAELVIGKSGHLLIP